MKGLVSIAVCDQPGVVSCCFHRLGMLDNRCWRLGVGNIQDTLSRVGDKKRVRYLAQPFVPRCDSRRDELHSED